MRKIPRSTVHVYPVEVALQVGLKGQYLAIRRAFQLLEDPEKNYALVLRTRTDFLFKIDLVTSVVVANFGRTAEAQDAQGNFLLFPCREKGWDVMGK
jgi:hypothetical protein